MVLWRHMYSKKGTWYTVHRKTGTGLIYRLVPVKMRMRY